MVALSWSTAVPQRTTVTPAHLPRTEGKVEEKVAASEQKNKEVADIKLFNLQADTFGKRTVATATETTVVEPVKAYAISSAPPLFDFGKSSGENRAAVAVPVNPEGKETAGALAKIEDNKGPGDKKQNQQNIYISWNNGLAGLRGEKVDIIV